MADRGNHRPAILLSFVDMLLVIVAILIVSVAPKKTSEGVKVQAEYLITAEWGKMLDTDVDLWGVGPPDQSKPCFYESLEVGALFLDRDSRGYMDDRLSGPDGHLLYLPHKEVMSLRGIVAGRYNFGLHLYQNRPSDGGVKRDPHALGIVVHIEVVKINPKVMTIFSRDYRLEYIGDAVNVFSMDILPDGNFVEADPPVEPITTRFYRQSSVTSQSYTPGAAATPSTP